MGVALLADRALRYHVTFEIPHVLTSDARLSAENGDGFAECEQTEPNNRLFPTVCNY